MSDQIEEVSEPDEAHLGLWGKRNDMIVHESDPYNAEPTRAVLAESPITPIQAFYDRNHGPIPDIDPGADAVGDDEDLCELVGGDDGGEAEDAEGGEGDECEEDEGGQCEVLRIDRPWRMIRSVATRSPGPTIIRSPTASAAGSISTSPPPRRTVTRSGTRSSRARSPRRERVRA